MGAATAPNVCAFGLNAFPLVNQMDDDAGKILGLGPDFETALDTAPFGFCLVNANTFQIHHANPAFGMMFHLPLQLRGHNLIDFLPQQFHAPLFTQNAASFEIEQQYDPHGNGLRWLQIKGEQVTHSGNSFYILWFIDVTLAKKAETQLRVAVEQADAAVEMKSNLLATMSHEIRTPMQAVYGILELIGEDADQGSNIATMTQTGKNAASDLLEILDDILDLAKLDADKMELDDFEIPIRTLCRGIIEALTFRKTRNVALLDDISDAVPFVVRGDPKRLRQVITNLLGNALKFTEEGSVTLRVTAETGILVPESHQIGIRFEVVDTGIGMPPHVCEKLFQPFTQADNTTTRKFGGTGLGLSISKKLVELMGGEIGVISEEGVGSTFFFEMVSEEIDTQVQAIDLPELEGLAVLVVEDHPRAVKEIHKSLRSMGAEVESCGHYDDAMDLIKARPFDVAVIDYGLPDKDGLMLMKQVSNLCPNTGLVMYTVHDDYQLQSALRSLGAKFLSKPASRTGLGEAVLDSANQDGHTLMDGSRRLLIAEDTESVRHIIQQQLSRLGVQADFVENGALAMEALKTGEYGILFTDLHMPEMDGYQLIHALREGEAASETDARFPVIVLTADVQMAQRQSYLAEGFDECLLKPVSLGQLRRLLIRWGVMAPEQAMATMDTVSDEAKTASVPSELPQADPPQADPEAEKAAEDHTNEAQDDLPPAIDLEMVPQLLGGLDAGSIEIIGMFVEMTEPFIADMQKAQAAQDKNELSEIGHSIKGSARMACCNRMGDLASDLQDHAASNDDAANAKLIEAIESELKRVEAQQKELAAQYG